MVRVSGIVSRQMLNFMRKGGDRFVQPSELLPLDVQLPSSAVERVCSERKIAYAKSNRLSVCLCVATDYSNLLGAASNGGSAPMRVVERRKCFPSLRDVLEARKTNRETFLRVGEKRL